MTEEERANYLARRREYYQRSRNPHLTSSVLDASERSNNNFAAPSTTDVISIPNAGESCGNATTVRQMCRIEPIPYRNLSLNFESGSTSMVHSTYDYDHPGDQLNLLNNLDAGGKSVTDDVIFANVITRCLQTFDGQLNRYKANCLDRRM